MRKPMEEIGDLEAILIQVLGPAGNINGRRFARATRWEQVKADEIEGVLRSPRR